MSVLFVITKVIYIIVCVVLTAIVLMQEGKNAGLSGSISGAAETYWGKNKGRSMEGTLVMITRILAGVFIVLSIILNMSFWNKYEFKNRGTLETECRYFFQDFCA